MDWFTFIAEMTEALVWPMTVLAALLVLREPLTSLIPALRTLKFKEFEAEFGRRLQQMEERAEEVMVADVGLVQSRTADTSSPLLSVERLAPISARAAVTEAWRLVELGMREALRQTGKEAPRSTRKLISALVQEDVIAREMASLLDEMRELRNAALHAPDLQISVDRAFEYGRLAERAYATLKEPV